MVKSERKRKSRAVPDFYFRSKDVIFLRTRPRRHLLRPHFRPPHLRRSRPRRPRLRTYRLPLRLRTPHRPSQRLPLRHLHPPHLRLPRSPPRHPRLLRRLRRRPLRRFRRRLLRPIRSLRAPLPLFPPPVWLRALPLPFPIRRKSAVPPHRGRALRSRRDVFSAQPRDRTYRRAP